MLIEQEFPTLSKEDEMLMTDLIEQEFPTL